MLSRLETLNLGMNNITGTIPSDIGMMTKLRTLRIENNKITGSIPPEFGLLTTLVTLRLEHNNIVGIVPSEIGMMTELRDFSLSANEISGTVPSEIGKLKELQYLSLFGNNMSGSLPSEIGIMTKLLELSLHLNDLTGDLDFLFCGPETRFYSKICIPCSVTCSCCDQGHCDYTTASKQINRSQLDITAVKVTVRLDLYVGNSILVWSFQQKGKNYDGNAPKCFSKEFLQYRLYLEPGVATFEIPAENYYNAGFQNYTIYAEYEGLNDVELTSGDRFSGNPGDPKHLFVPSKESIGAGNYNFPSFSPSSTVTTQTTKRPCPVVPEGSCLICGEGKCVQNVDSFIGGFYCGRGESLILAMSGQFCEEERSRFELADGPAICGCA
mmetsp:Transcript_6932/g.10118  ORF Transcript_6932/g.10118 Transcript_6932/m.10118 type:complete len:383 (-) Transcript_6932:158-1306(-)